MSERLPFSGIDVEQPFLESIAARNAGTKLVETVLATESGSLKETATPKAPVGRALRKRVKSEATEGQSQISRRNFSGCLKESD